MSEIPKRRELVAHSGDVGAEIASYVRRVTHEHAVAKVAVEALRALLNSKFDYTDQVAAREALAKIEQSGWRQS